MQLFSSILLIIWMADDVMGSFVYSPKNHGFVQSPEHLLENYIKLRIPRRVLTKAGTKRTQRSNGSCREIGFICSTPFNLSFTSRFKCHTDNQCPTSYKCCSQKCFQHKICVQAINSVNEDPSCSKWPYDCPSPYPYAFSLRFKCDRHEQCISGYKCCTQKCFMHRICSKKVVDTPSRMEQKPVENLYNYSLLTDGRPFGLNLFDNNEQPTTLLESAKTEKNQEADTTMTTTQLSGWINRSGLQDEETTERSRKTSENIDMNVAIFSRFNGGETAIIDTTTTEKDYVTTRRFPIITEEMNDNSITTIDPNEISSILNGAVNFETTDVQDVQTMDIQTTDVTTTTESEYKEYYDDYNEENETENKNKY